MKKQIQLIKELITYLQISNCKFEFMIKPVIYNLTLQTYTDNVNSKINNMFVLYKSMLSTYKNNIEQIIYLLPEEYFVVFNIIDNNKYIFKMTHDLLLNKLYNDVINHLNNIFDDIFITTNDTLYNVISNIINSVDYEIETIFHARFLTAFLTENIQKILTVNNTLLTNLLQITNNLKIGKHKLYIDLEYISLFDINNIISTLVCIDIDTQDKDHSIIKQSLDNIIDGFSTYIDGIQYNKFKKPEINIAYIMKNTSLLHWLILIYLFNNIQYI